MKTFGLIILTLLLLPRVVAAQNTCGWSEPPARDRLPRNVEGIITQLPASFYKSDEIISNLNQWYRECDGTAARKAIFDLRRALDRARGNHAIGALLGSALMHGPEVQVQGATGTTNRATYHMTNSEREGARLLARAGLEPGLNAAAIEVAVVALATRHAPTVELSMETLRQVATRDGDPALWNMLAELSLVIADYETAVESGKRALDLGDTTALHAVGVARLMGDPDTVAAAAAYLSGLDAGSGLHYYYDDLSYLLLPSDTLEWQKLDAGRRGEWLRQQWEWRAVTSSQTVPQRLKEHFKRLAHAMEHYPRTAFSTPPPANAVTFDAMTRRMSIDDRGLIYVRHGTPDAVIRMGLNSGDDTRLGWGYRNLGSGSALFEFSKNDCVLTASGGAQCTPVGDYFMVAPLPCGVGNPEGFIDYASQIVQYDPGLAASHTSCFSAMVAGNAMMIAQHRLRDMENRQRSIIDGQVALRTESAARAIVEPISAFVKTYAMRDGGRTTLTAAAALDGSVIKPAAGTTDYGLQFMLSVEHPTTRTAQRADTTLRFTTPAPMTAGEVANVRISTPAAATADATVRFTVRNANDPAQGQIITTARAIPDFSGDRFALSDLVIAGTNDGSWVRGGIRLAPIAAHQVTEGAAFRLFHEIYGAQNGDSLTVQITIAPGESESIMGSIRSLIQRRSAQQIGFTERADVDAAGTARLVREVGTDLEPGRYVVILTVQNARRQATAEARTDLVILEPR